MMFRDESIIARAKQVLDLEEFSKAKLTKRFRTVIANYHPDRVKSYGEEQAKVLIEAYNVLKGELKPSECRLLEDDELVASLLPDGVTPVPLGLKYENWLKETFYDFVKP